MMFQSTTDCIYNSGMPVARCVVCNTIQVCVSRTYGICITIKLSNNIFLRTYPCQLSGT